MKFQAASVGAYLALALAVLYTYLRVFQGVDFFDESYWVAFQWRFALGDRPYVDERSFHQNFAVLLWPFVALYWWFYRTAEGLVLYTRFIYLVATWAIAWVTFFYFRKRFEHSTAVLFAIVFLLLPFAPPNFSYTTLGVYGFFLGCLCLFWREESFTVPLALVAGVSHAVATASDPTLLAGVLAVAGMVAWLAPHGGKAKLLAAYGSPLVLLGVTMMSYAGRDGLAAIFESALYLDHSKFTVDFFSHARDLLAVPYRGLWLIFFLAVMAAWTLRTPYAALLAFGVLPVACLWVVLTMGYGTKFFFAYFGLIGLGVFPFLSSQAKGRRWFLTFWIPSLVMAIAYTWAGNRGGVARFGGGMVLATFATLVWMSELARSYSAHWRRVPLWSCLACLGFLVFLDLPEARGKVFTSGPFKGIRAEAAKVDWLERLAAEVARVERRDSRVLFHPHFPAGYLLTPMRPASGNVWWTYALDEHAGLAFMRDFDRYAAEPRIVVQVHELFYNPMEVNPGVPSRFDRIGPEVARRFTKRFSSSQFDVYEAAGEKRVAGSPW